MIRISYKVRIGMENIKYWERVRREATDTATRLVLKLGHGSFKTPLTMGQSRNPHASKFWANHKLRRIWAVGINCDFVWVGLHWEGRSTSLNPTKVEVWLIVDAPHFVSNQATIFARIQRSIRVYMDHGWHVTVVVHLQLRVYT